LVAQEQVLEDQVAAAAQRRGEDAEQEREQFEHARSMTDRGCGPREVLPSDSGLSLVPRIRQTELLVHRSADIRIFSAPADFPAARLDMHLKMDLPDASRRL
jgi:hypothetical protein